jgi:hypothetical protein
MHSLRCALRGFALVAALLAAPLFAAVASAQATAPVTPPPDDTPSIKLGVTLFTDYTVQQQPKILDSDGNAITFNQFNVGRAYLNVTGNISHLLAFRITPDIVRETGPGSSLNGSYTFRLKYAYAQLNLDDWTGPSSWVRLGAQPTPWIDFITTLYRYRFQGSVIEEREGFLVQGDTGASFASRLPGQYGDVHTGFYNGETYTHAEVNNQKAFQTRVTIRPAPRGPLSGLRLTGFYDHDAYVKNAARRRAIAAVTFEHRRVNAAFSYLAATDRTSVSTAAINARGYSAWATPRITATWEGLLRLDHLEPDSDRPGVKKRTIAGVAYWLPHQGPVSAALLLDVDDVKYAGFTLPRPAERRIGLHALVNF